MDIFRIIGTNPLYLSKDEVKINILVKFLLFLTVSAATALIAW